MLRRLQEVRHNWKVIQLRNSTTSVLTVTENKVLRLVAEALSNKEIAAKMGLSPSTVKRHVENILRKLLLRNRVEAAVYAVKAGLVASNNEKS
jgi:DNA-binding NarL/FixJ family response regulator